MLLDRAVLIAIDDTFWFESGPVTNWTLRDSVVVDVNYGPGRRDDDVLLSAFTPKFPAGVATGVVHRNITVQGNVFNKTSASTGAVGVWATAGLVFANNTVHVPSSVGGCSGVPGGVVGLFRTVDCTDVLREGNTCAR